MPSDNRVEPDLPQNNNAAKAEEAPASQSKAKRTALCITLLVFISVLLLGASIRSYSWSSYWAHELPATVTATNICLSVFTLVLLAVYISWGQHGVAIGFTLTVLWTVISYTVMIILDYPHKSSSGSSTGTAIIFSLLGPLSSEQLTILSGWVGTFASGVLFYTAASVNQNMANVVRSLFITFATLLLQSDIRIKIEKKEKGLSGENTYITFVPAIACFISLQLLLPSCKCGCFNWAITKTGRKWLLCLLFVWWIPGSLFFECMSSFGCFAYWVVLYLSSSMCFEQFHLPKSDKAVQQDLKFVLCCLKTWCKTCSEQSAEGEVFAQVAAIATDAIAAAEEAGLQDLELQDLEGSNAVVEK